MTAGTRYGFADLQSLMSLMTGDEKHDAAATSTLDVLWVLYDRVLRVSSQNPEEEARDRFLLSKGHGPMAYYAVLTAKGFIEADLLPGYGSFGSALGRHPDRNLLAGVEISSGSLGHGLPLAVGIALGLRAKGLTNSRLFVLVGDGELDEGSNHEAIAFAGATGLDSLNALSDIPNRVLGLGVGREELRMYGTPEEHQAAHGLDPASLRARISGFLGAGNAARAAGER